MRLTKLDFVAVNSFDAIEQKLDKDSPWLHTRQFLLFLFTRFLPFRFLPWLFPLMCPKNLFNPLSEPFLGLFFKKYRKFDFVTQFLRNGSTKIQSFVYHFVANFILFQKTRDVFHDFASGRRYGACKPPLPNDQYICHRQLKG